MNSNKVMFKGLKILIDKGAVFRLFQKQTDVSLVNILKAILSSYKFNFVKNIRSLKNLYLKENLNFLAFFDNRFERIFKYSRPAIKGPI